MSDTPPVPAPAYDKPAAVVVSERLAELGRAIVADSAGACGGLARWRSAS